MRTSGRLAATVQSAGVTSPSFCRVSIVPAATDSALLIAVSSGRVCLHRGSFTLSRLSASFARFVFHSWLSTMLADITWRSASFSVRDFCASSGHRKIDFTCPTHRHVQLTTCSRVWIILAKRHSNLLQEFRVLLLLFQMKLFQSLSVELLLPSRWNQKMSFGPLILQ